METFVFLARLTPFQEKTYQGLFIYAIAVWSQAITIVTVAIPDLQRGISGGNLMNLNHFLGVPLRHA